MQFLTILTRDGQYIGSTTALEVVGNVISGDVAVEARSQVSLRGACGIVRLPDGRMGTTGELTMSLDWAGPGDILRSSITVDALEV
jgi:hypothetical protein